MAPPGRTRATARMRQQGNSLSRPSSVHVDDFQRGVGAKQDLPTARSGGPGRGAHPGSSGQRGPSQGGPSLQKLLSDPAVVAVCHVTLTKFISHLPAQSSGVSHTTGLTFGSCSLESSSLKPFCNLVSTRPALLTCYRQYRGMAYQSDCNKVTSTLPYGPSTPPYGRVRQ